MPNTEIKQSYIYIHIAVILFGFTAILGGLIELPAIMIVWWRVLLTSLSLLFFVNWGKKVLTLPKELILKYLFVGVIIGLHWLTFYGAIKLSNASITLICMSTTSLFTAILEPLIVRTPFRKHELLIGLLIVPAMVLIVSDLDTSFSIGVGVGIVSALLAAVFSSINKVLINEADTYTITFLELSGSWLFLSVLLMVIIPLGGFEGPFLPMSWMDVLWLFIMALLCTTLAQILALKALKQLSTYATNLVINLEPIYGIILAALILNDHKNLNGTFYLGAAIILGSVMLYPRLSKKFK